MIQFDNLLCEIFLFNGGASPFVSFAVQHGLLLERVMVSSKASNTKRQDWGLCSTNMHPKSQRSALFHHVLAALVRRGHFPQDSTWCSGGESGRDGAGTFFGMS